MPIAFINDYKNAPARVGPYRLAPPFIDDVARRTVRPDYSVLLNPNYNRVKGIVADAFGSDDKESNNEQSFDHPGHIIESLARPKPLFTIDFYRLSDLPPLTLKWAMEMAGIKKFGFDRISLVGIGNLYSDYSGAWIEGFTGLEVEREIAPLIHGIGKFKPNQVVFVNCDQKDGSPLSDIEYIYPLVRLAALNQIDATDAPGARTVGSGFSNEARAYYADKRLGDFLNIHCKLMIGKTKQFNSVRRKYAELR